MKKIVIVDDEPNIVMTLEYTFKKHDFEVYIARDGSEALEILQSVIPDVIMLDVMMPKVDGYQTLKLIDKKAYMDYKNILQENCSYYNFDFVDCNDHLGNNNFDKQWLFVDRSHLTDLGNKHVAEFILSRAL